MKSISELKMSELGLNKKTSELGLIRFKDDRISLNDKPIILKSYNKILKSNNPKNHNSDK